MGLLGMIAAKLLILLGLYLAWSAPAQRPCPNEPSYVRMDPQRMRAMARLAPAASAVGCIASPRPARPARPARPVPAVTFHTSTMPPTVSYPGK